MDFLTMLVSDHHWVSPSSMVTASWKRWEGQANKVHMVLIEKERKIDGEGGRAICNV